MSASGILIAVDGETLDLHDVTWLQIAPCGCCCGGTVAFSDYGKGPAHIVATADQAMAELWETKPLREKRQRLGYTVRPVRRGDMPKMNCDHDPKWGWQPPSLDGHEWAVGGYYGERTRVRHLIPSGFAQDRDGLGGYKSATAVCGVEKSHWSREWHVMDGKVECTRCERKAAS